LFGRCRKSWPVVLCAAGLFLFSWPPAAWLALFPFELPYPNYAPTDKNVQAIVVLSSSVFPPTPPRPTAILGSDTLERCQYAAWLYKNWVHVPVLATGGGSHGPPYAETMSEELQREGVPAAMIWTEGKSRSTYENALFSTELLRKKGIRRIALVTEAFHMRRAELCFRKQGMDLVPAACGFRTKLWVDKGWLIPGWEPISWNEDVMHESIGLLWYKLKGRI
jgi:uncharacterized SAM-binding protein YcdF (DUF218 family)